MRGVLPAFAVAVLLTACSSGPEAPEPKTATTAIPSAAATTEAAHQATVEQWAGEVAVLAGDWQDATDTWEEAVCSSIAAAEAVDCGARLVAMGFISQTASITLDGLQDENGPTYLGAAPSQITSLLEETTQAARGAAAAAELVDCPGEECIGPASEFLRSWEALGDAYDKWAPYL